jgi:hypothetical protein
VFHGLCSDCAILKADYNLADKEGKRLDLSEGVYLHHAIVMDTSQTQPGLVLQPVCTMKDYADTLANLLTPKPKSAGGMSGGMSSIGNMGGHGHSSRDTSQIDPRYVRPQKRQFVPGMSLGSSIPATMITKGGEDKESFYRVLNSTLTTGFWLGKQDNISASIEAINYKNEAKEVYFAIDYEYLSFPDGKPKNFYDVSMGMMTSNGCGNLAFCQYYLRMHESGSLLMNCRSTQG